MIKKLFGITVGEQARITRTLSWDRFKVGDIVTVLDIYEAKWDEESPYKADIQFKNGKREFGFDLHALEPLY